MSEKRASVATNVATIMAALIGLSCCIVIVYVALERMRARIVRLPATLLRIDVDPDMEVDSERHVHTVGECSEVCRPVSGSIHVRVRTSGEAKRLHKRLIKAIEQWSTDEAAGVKDDK